MEYHKARLRVGKEQGFILEYPQVVVVVSPLPSGGGSRKEHGALLTLPISKYCKTFMTSAVFSRRIALTWSPRGNAKLFHLQLKIFQSKLPGLIGFEFSTLLSELLYRL